MDCVIENFSTKEKASTIRSARSRKPRRKSKTENISSRRQKDFANPIREPYHNNLCSVFYPTPINGYVTCEGDNYFKYRSPHYKNKYYRKMLRGANYDVDEIDRHNSKSFREFNAMRAIQDEMQEMRSKLSTVVETLSNVVDTLVKSSKEEEEKSEDESAQPEYSTHEKAVQFNEHKIRPRNSDRTGFCCFKSHSVKSRESNSDYYRPRLNLTSDSRSHKKRSEPDVAEDRIPPETKSSSESSGSIGCQNLTVCHFLQRLLYRTKLLFV